MTEVWKRIVCSSVNCMAEALDAKGKVIENFYIYPEIDNDVLTQFTCLRCGLSETWGLTRRNVAKTLYERLNNA